MFNIALIGFGAIGYRYYQALEKINLSKKIFIIDKNQKVMNDASNGIEPFEEIDFEDNLNEALKNGLNFSNDMSVVAQTDYVFITLGTSSNKDDIKLFDGVIDQVLRNVEDETKIILRSTVFPGAMRRITKKIRNINKNIGISYCPERVAQGKSLEEIENLIGSKNRFSKYLR